MLLRNEGAVIKWLSQYEAIERRQLKEMINKSLASSDSFVNSMLKQSRIAKATPSSTAWSRSSLDVSIDIPINVPRAFVSLIGLRSPIKYGRKYT